MKRPTPDDGAQAEALKLGWQRVVLVCRQCQKRSSGPPRLKTKAVVAALKGALKRAPSRTRIATTGCLGPCPKKAITVAMPASGDARAAGWAVGDVGEARALGALLAREGAVAGGASAVAGAPSPPAAAAPEIPVGPTETYPA